MRSAPPVRLLHVTTVPQTFVFLRGQLAFMKSHGLDVHVMSSPGPEMEAFSRSEGATAHPIPMARRITPFRDLVTLFRMVRIFRSIHPDIVHASTPKGGLLGTIAGRIARVPLVIYHVRGLPYTAARGAQGMLLRTTEKIACSLAHQVLCVSDSVKKRLVADQLADASKTVVILNGSSNGVDAQGRFNPALASMERTQSLRGNLGIPAESMVLGFVGRLVGDKGVDDLAAAFELVLQAHPNTHLLIVGTWEPRDAVPARTRTRLEAHSQVHIVGEQSDTASYYSLMDVLVFPTLREGFPNVPLEAAAMAIPVAATSVIGCVDAVEHGKTGYLVEARNPRQLADSITRYLSDSGLRREHGDAARRRAAELFDPEMIWTALHDNYAAALANRTSR